MIDNSMIRENDQQLFLVGDKVKVGDLEVEIKGFKSTTGGTFAVTDYGNFNIDLLTKDNPNPKNK